MTGAKGCADVAAPPGLVASQCAHAPWLAAAAAVAAVLFGARQAGRNAERVENMRRTIDVQHDQLKAASRRPRDRNELARRMRDGFF
jgi:hypothetical protein